MTKPKSSDYTGYNCPVCLKRRATGKHAKCSRELQRRRQAEELK